MLNAFAVGRRGEAPSGDCKSGAGSRAGVFQFRLLLIGGLPPKNRHRDSVRTAQITLHLLLKIRKRIETQIVVKPFLVVSVTSLDLSIMPRGSRTDQFVLDLVVITEHVKRMDTIGF